MKYLITGGAGFIGSHLVDKLIEESHEVTVIDNLSTGKKENLNPKAVFYNIDILDPKVSQVFEKEKPEIVFHYAAHIEARESVKDPLSDAKTNIIGSLNVLENCRKFNIKKTVFASSGGEIYGDATVIPTPENYPPNPISPYGVAKLTIEKYLNSYFKIYGFKFVAARLGNVYGPRQNPNGEAGVIAIFTNKMLKNEDCFIHGEGKQTKDYIYIEDAVRATINLSKIDFVGAINISTSKEISVIEIFNKLKELTGYKKEAQRSDFPTCGFKRGSLSIKKAKEVIDWSPEYDFDKGLKLTVDWFKDRKNNDDA